MLVSVDGADTAAMSLDDVQRCTAGPVYNITYYYTYIYNTAGPVRRIRLIP